MDELKFLLTWQCWLGLFISSLSTGIFASIVGIKQTGWRTGVMTGIAFSVGVLTVLYYK